MNQEYKVNLSQGQKAKLAKAIKDGSALKLRLGKNALSGNDDCCFPPGQIAKLQKAKRNNSGLKFHFPNLQFENQSSMEEVCGLPVFPWHQSSAICNKRSF